MELATITTVAKKDRLVRAPLAPVAVAMIAGIVAGRWLGVEARLWAWGAAAGAVVAMAAMAWQRRARQRTGRWANASIEAACGSAEAAAAGKVVTAGLLAAVVCLSAAYLRWCYFGVPADHIYTYTSPTRALATIEGQVVSAPQIVSDQPGAGIPYRRPARTCFVLEASGIETQGGWAAVRGLVRVTVGEPTTHLAAGQRVRMTCWLGRYGEAKNPGGTDWAQVGRLNHTMVWAKAALAAGVTPVDGGPQGWARAGWNVWASLRGHLQTAGEDELGGELVNALILGDRHRDLQGLNQAMMRAGVAHYLSISGSHLAIFLGMVYLLCRLAGVLPRYAAITVLGVLGGYMLLAEPNAPLLRSAIMAAALCVAVILERPYSALNALAAALVVLLAIDPLDLFTAGFQLSFGIVLGMLVLTMPIRRWLFGRWLTRRGLVVYRGAHRWRRWAADWAAEWGASAVAMSAAAYVVSAPLVAYHFGMFNPYAAPLSLLLTLPVALVLLPGYLSLALLWPMPNLSGALGAASTRAAEALNRSVEWMQLLPGLSIELRPVSVAWVLACYALMGLLLWRRKAWQGWAAGAMAAVMAGMFVWSQLPCGAPPQARLHVLAVGAGQCAVLETPSGKTYVFDAGTRSAMDCWSQALGPFLRQMRMRWPEAVFVSHADGDHYNALPSLIRVRPPGRAYLGEFFAADAKVEGAAWRLVEEMRAAGVAMVSLWAGQEIALDDRTKVRVLWPAAEQKQRNVNDTSLVLQVTCDGKSVLLTGDIADDARRALAKLLPACDAMVLPHHGGWTEGLPALVARVNPRVVVASNAMEPRGAGRGGAAEFWRRLRGERQVWTTWQDGCVVVEFGADGVACRRER